MSNTRRIFTLLIILLVAPSVFAETGTIRYLGDDCPPKDYTHTIVIPTPFGERTISTPTEEVRKFGGRGIKGDHCVSVDETNTVCVSSVNAKLICSKGKSGNFYQHCEANIQLSASTDYGYEDNPRWHKGVVSDEYLRVHVDCAVNIEYETRDGLKRSERHDVSTKRLNEPFCLIPNIARGRGMIFDFSLNPFMEIVDVNLQSTDCQIDKVEVKSIK